MFVSHTLYAVSPESVSAQPSDAAHVNAVICRVAVAAPLLLRTVMVNIVCAILCVGLPLIVAVAGLKYRPAGSVGEMVREVMPEPVMIGTMGAICSFFTKEKVVFVSVMLGISNTQLFTSPLQYAGEP